MKVHFVFAPTLKKFRLGELSEGRVPPLSLLYLASYLRKRWEGNLEMRFTDGLLAGMEQTIKEVVRFSPDVVAVSFYTPQAEGAYVFVNTVKKACPESFVVVGGVHATSLPEDVFARCKPDLLVTGEGEETFLEVVKLVAGKRTIAGNGFSEVAGIAFFAPDARQVIKTPTRHYIQRLDAIPFPAYDLLELKDYKGWYLNKGGLEAPILSSRGCPYWCTFCSNLVWKLAKPHLRLRSPENVVDEIEFLVKEYGVREINDCSDEFNNNITNALAICREIKRRGLKIWWKTSLRVDRLPEELIKEMAESGCWYVLLGIESGNERTLQGIEKKITLDYVVKACRLLKRYRIKIQGLFMLYNVWEEKGRLEYETSLEVKKTLDYAYGLVKGGLLDYVGWSVTVPYPGSKLYEITGRHNLIRPEYQGNWEAWLKRDSYVFALPGISRQEQIRLKTKGSFLRAKLILRERQIRWKDVPWLFNKGLKVILNEIKARAKHLSF
ncbi:MAG: radical SAM protein [Candidatus Omnitrophota bacterium]